MCSDLGHCHIILISSYPSHPYSSNVESMLSVRLGTDKYQICKLLVWLNWESNSQPCSRGSLRSTDLTTASGVHVIYIIYMTLFSNAYNDIIFIYYVHNIYMCDIYHIYMHIIMLYIPYNIFNSCAIATSDCAPSHPSAANTICHSHQYHKYYSL